MAFLSKKRILQFPPSDLRKAKMRFCSFKLIKAALKGYLAPKLSDTYEQNCNKA